MESQENCVKFRGLRFLLVAAALAALFAVTGLAQMDTHLPWEGGTEYYAHWPLGLRHDQDFFPVGTWTSPWNAPLFQGIGFNTWVALFDGTVEIDPGDGPLLPLLSDYGIPLIGDQASAFETSNGTNPTTGKPIRVDPMTGRPYLVEALEHHIDPIINGWMQQDEPDNAQGPVNGNYLDCVPPSPAYYNSTDTGAPGTIPGPSVLTLYRQFRAADPFRPVYLGLGQGTGYNNYPDCYYGRGSTCCSASRNRMTTPSMHRVAIFLTPTFTRRTTAIPCGGPAGRPTGCAIGPTTRNRPGTTWRWVILTAIPRSR